MRASARNLDADSRILMVRNKPFFLSSAAQLDVTYHNSSHKKMHNVACGGAALWARSPPKRRAGAERRGSCAPARGQPQREGAALPAVDGRGSKGVDPDLSGPREVMVKAD
jgi:hypothetical protein